MTALHQPAPDRAEPILWHPIQDFLHDLDLRVSGPAKFSRAGYKDHERNLNHFGSAWHVAWDITLPGGRQVRRAVLVPHLPLDQEGKPIKRRPPLKFAASTAAEAEAEAVKIARQLPSLSAMVAVHGPVTVRRNGDRPFSELCNDDLQIWLIANPQWQSGWTRENNIKSIMQCYTWFAEEHDLRPPFKKHKLPKITEKHQRRQATDAEYIDLMRHSALVSTPNGHVRVKGSPRALRRALWALYNCGMRTCEMREMVWNDIDWQTGVVRLWKHKNERSTGKPRLITLTKRQYWFFRNLHRQRPAWPENVFLNTRGKPWNRTSFAKVLRETCKRIGLDASVTETLTAYCFRHTYATQADESGARHEDAAMLMGHSPEVFDKIYSKAKGNVKHRRKAATEIEQGRRKQRGEQGELFGND